MYYPVELGKNIVTLREAQGLSQEELAERADICTTWMREIEHDCANVARDIVERIAKALDVPVWMLYALQAEPETVRDELDRVQKLLRPAKEAVLV